jgi:HEAT repeat protein
VTAGPGLLNPDAPVAKTSKDLARPEIEDASAWQLWWNFNRDPLLDLTSRIGERARATGDDPLAVRRKIRQAFAQLALPELARLLVDGGDSSMVRESILAIARVSNGEIPNKIDLEHHARFFLSDPNAEVRMASILALGIQGDPQGIPLLSSLLRDDDDAHDLVEGRVSERDRSLAALALGMIAKHTEWTEMRTDLARLMSAEIQGAPWQVGVACTLALGQMPLDPCKGTTPKEQQLEGGHVCQNSVLSLLSSLALATSEHAWLRAHAACSAGRLASGAQAEVRGEVADVLLYLVDPRADVGQEIRLGALIGLGLLVREPSGAVDGKALECLLEHAKRDDGMARRFSLVALAEVGGRARLPAERVAALRDLLASELGTGRKENSGWAALALGVFARGEDQDRETKSWAANLLRGAVDGANSPGDAGAAALALGLVGDSSAATCESLLRQYRRFQDPAFRVFGGLALGLLAIPEAKPLLAAAFGRDASVAVPLRLLGDGDVVQALLERAHGSDLPDAVDAVRALGRTHAAEAVGPLVEIVAEKRLSPALRATAIAALGDLADEDPVHWTSIYANDLQYQLLTPTLHSPSSQGLGLLDERVAALR